MLLLLLLLLMLSLCPVSLWSTQTFAHRVLGVL